MQQTNAIKKKQVAMGKAATAMFEVSSNRFLEFNASKVYVLKSTILTDLPLKSRHVDNNASKQPRVNPFVRPPNGQGMR